MPPKLVPTPVVTWLRAASAKAIVSALIAIDPAKAAEIGVELYLRGAGTVGATGDQVVKEIKENPVGSLGRAFMGGVGALLNRPSSG